MTTELDDATARDNAGAVVRGPRICVFDPSPIFTVTIENGSGDPAASDQIYFHAGGQGFWVARMIRNLGAAPVLCGPIGGETGVIVTRLIEMEGIDLLPVTASGWNGGYVHDRRQGPRESLATMRAAPLNRHEADDLYDRALTAGLEAGTLVLTGLFDEAVWPKSFYSRLVADLAENEVRVVADVSAAVLRELEARIDFLKVSHEQVIDAGFSPDDELASLRQAARTLCGKTGRNVVVSRADKPALALVENSFFEIVPPKFHPRDHRGAGDSMTGAIAYGLATGMSAEETLKLAAAAGALNVTRGGLGTGDVRNIREIARLVEVRKA